MFTNDDRSGRFLRDIGRPPIGARVAAMALVFVVACSSKDASLSGTGGGSASGGHPGGTGGDSGSGGADSGGGHQGATGGAPGSGGSGAGGRGGVTGSGRGGRGGNGGVKGSGGAPGTGGHDISPVVCGNTMCQLTYQCCIACDGSHACAPTCTSPVCPDAGAGGGGGSGPADAGQMDAASDAASSLGCGTMTCGPQEVCVTPPGPGTCVMPDGGQCPTGTSLSGSCCLPSLVPSCVAIDRPCNGPTVTCACFSVDPCGSGLCVGASFQGHNVICRGA
jgi:hypothetical protein